MTGKDDAYTLLVFYKSRNFADCDKTLRSRFLTLEDVSTQFFNDYFDISVVSAAVEMAHINNILDKAMLVRCPNCHAGRVYEPQTFPLKGFSIYFKTPHKCLRCEHEFLPDPKRVTYGTLLGREDLPILPIEDESWREGERWTPRGRLKRWFRRIFK